MSQRQQPPTLSPAMDNALGGRLADLARAGHKADALLKQTGLPRRYRKPVFFFLGHIAKAEGRVTETDIRYAQSLMNALALSTRQRRKAIAQFQQGKNVANLPLHKGLWLRLSARLAPSAAITSAICLCHGAQIHGRPGKARRYRCEDSIARLGLPITVADELFESYASKAWARNTPVQERPATYEQACQVLGVTRRDSLTVIKSHYRKKVSACHPDKLAQQQLTASEKALAKDQLLRYQQAWELIKKRH